MELTRRRTLHVTLCFLVERKSNNNTAKDQNRKSKNKDNELLFHRNEKIVITIEKKTHDNTRRKR